MPPLSGERPLERANGLMGAELLRYDLRLDHLLGGIIQVFDVAPVIVASVVLSLLEHGDGGLLSEDGGAALHQLDERSPGPRRLRRIAAAAAYLFLQDVGPRFVGARTMLQGGLLIE